VRDDLSGLAFEWTGADAALRFLEFRPDPLEDALNVLN
jgi:hypothetical protein